MLNKKIKSALVNCPILYFFAKKIYRSTKSLMNKSVENEALRRELLTLELDRPKQLKRFSPQASMIEITNACNLNCLMCNTKLSKRPVGYMSPEVFEEIIIQLQSIGINSADLHTVGEPFMHNHLNLLLEVAQRNSFGIGLSTNGQFPQRIRKTYYKFPKLATRFNFSIDGATRETYENIRRGASFKKLLESLEAVREINNGFRDFRVDVSITSILNLSNMFEIPQYFKTFSRYCRKQNINFNLINGLSLDDSYFKDTFPWKNIIHSTVPCHMPFRFVYFTYDGQATLCCRDYEGELIVGNLHNESLQDIWDSHNAETIRGMHMGTEEMKINSCASCFEPIPFVSMVVNKYIHRLYGHSPEMDPKEFGNSVACFLDEMDNAIRENDLPRLKTGIMERLELS